VERNEPAAPAGVERPRLVGLAFRMLGTVADAEDAVQESFVRWYRLDAAAREGVANPVGWFVTTTSRICLDVLKSAAHRHERYVGPWLPEPLPDGRFTTSLRAVDSADPLEHVVRADSVSMALLTVLDTMSPAERVAFVLRDVFDYPVAEVAAVLDRSPGAVRQLASSARSRIDRAGAGGATGRPELAEVVGAFGRAANGGDVSELVRLLHPGAVLRSDGGGVVRAALNPISGADKVARFLIGVLERQAPITLVAHDDGAEPVLTFVRKGEVTGVLALGRRTGHGQDAGLVREVWVQWNPAKLGLWGGGRTPT
jgi:RNA polymerase sigma-70 factor (ECF subfamily)